MTRNERFSRGIHSLERALTDLSDTSKAKLLSDGGDGVRRMLDDLDGDGNSPTKFQIDRDRSTMVDVAAMLLVWAGLGHLVRTLYLVFANGSHLRSISIRALCRDKRRKSAKQASKRLYELHRKALLSFFVSPDVHGDIEGRDVGEVPTR